MSDYIDVLREKWIYIIFLILSAFGAWSSFRERPDIDTPNGWRVAPLTKSLPTISPVEGTDILKILIKDVPDASAKIPKPSIVLSTHSGPWHWRYADDREFLDLYGKMVGADKENLNFVKFGNKEGYHAKIELDEFDKVIRCDQFAFPRQNRIISISGCAPSDEFTQYKRDIITSVKSITMPDGANDGFNIFWGSLSLSYAIFASYTIYRAVSDLGDKKPSNKRVKSPRVIVGDCPGCGRKIRVRETALKPKMILTCKCGRQNEVNI